MDDLDDLHAILRHPDVWRYDLHREISLAETRELLHFRVLEARKHGFGHLAVVSKTRHRLLGYCGLQLCLAPECSGYTVPYLELVYGLAPEHWGRGFATEAAGRVIRMAFEELKAKRLMSGAERDNARSIAVMRRVGMRVESCGVGASMVLGTLEHPSREAPRAHG